MSLYLLVSWALEVRKTTTFRESEILIAIGDFSFPASEVAVSGATAVGDVHVTEKVSLALETDGGHTVRDGVTLDNLLLDGLSKICMTFVCRTEK